MKTNEKTERLPVFKSLFPVSQPEPRRRYPRTAESMAVTQPMPCFGGDEVR